MPELPEVETIVRTYRPRLEGRQIVRFVSRVATQAEPSVIAVRRGIVGTRICRLWRRAKYIVADLESCGRSGRARARAATCGRTDSENVDSLGHLLIHLRMSGRFEWAAEHEREPEHVRAYFDLDDGNRLLFCDMRKFGKIIYTADLEAGTSQLGIEPLDRRFTAAALEKALRGRGRQLKPLLLDQSVVAGLGNIYTDEALFQAGLHPTMRSDRLTSRQIRRLRTAIRAVLRKAIRHQGTSFDQVYRGGGMRKYLKVYGRGGRPCKRCKTPIKVLRIAQRGTHICPRCQSSDGRG